MLRFTLTFLIIIPNYVVLCQNLNSSFLESNPNRKVFVRSHHSLTELASHEKYIYALLRHYLVSLGEDANDEKLMAYIDDYEDTSGLLMYLPEEDQDRIVADHPSFSYRMISRYVLNLMPMLDDLLHVGGFTNILEQVLISPGWPVMEDVEDSMDAIVRLQFVYDIDIPKFAAGDFLSASGFGGLRAQHCYAIGNFAITKFYYAAAVDWLLHAKFLVEERYDDSVDRELVEDALDHAIKIHDTKFEENPEYDPGLFTTKFETIQEFPDLKQTRRQYLAEIWKGERGRNFNDINFWNLCSGEDLRTEEEKSSLFCWYDQKSNPALTISPLKVEQLAITLPLFQVYDVLSEKVIKKILQEGQPSLEKSILYNRFGTDLVRNRRTSATSWIKEPEHPELAHVPKLAEWITGLVIDHPEASEILHVATYTFGSHYDVHHDILNEDPSNWMSKHGDRMATLMFYLSDVEHGGYTAFPQAGIAVRPHKGSAVFWFNMKRSGVTDYNAYHGACPVLIGSKWIATKWIHSHKQFLKRPCSLNADE